MSKQSMQENIAALAGGTVFGAGLVIAGMTNPDKVLAFLTLNQNWDPALIFVMGSAVVVATIGYWLVGKRGSPLFDSGFHAPANRVIDQPLIVGSGLFGVGWGISGFCPGPAIVGLLTFDLRAVIFIAAYVVGVLLFERWQRGQLSPDGAVDG